MEQDATCQESAKRTTAHQRTIRAILDFFPTARTKGFMKAVDRAMRAGGWDDRRFPVALVPDAFMVNEADRQLVAFEVEDHHPLSPSKLAAYARPWWDLDCAEWDLELRTYRRIAADEHIVNLRAHQFQAFKSRAPYPAGNRGSRAAAVKATRAEAWQRALARHDRIMGR